MKLEVVYYDRIYSRVMEWKMDFSTGEITKNSIYYYARSIGGLIMSAQWLDKNYPRYQRIKVDDSRYRINYYPDLIDGLVAFGRAFAEDQYHENYEPGDGLLRPALIAENLHNFFTLALFVLAGGFQCSLNLWPSTVLNGIESRGAALGALDGYDVDVVSLDYCHRSGPVIDQISAVNINFAYRFDVVNEIGLKWMSLTAEDVMACTERVIREEIPNYLFQRLFNKDAMKLLDDGEERMLDLIFQRYNYRPPGGDYYLELLQHREQLKRNNLITCDVEPLEVDPYLIAAREYQEWMNEVDDGTMRL